MPRSARFSGVRPIGRMVLGSEPSGRRFNTDRLQARHAPNYLLRSALVDSQAYQITHRITDLPVPIAPLDREGFLRPYTGVLTVTSLCVLGHREPPTLLDPDRPTGLAWQSGRPPGTFAFGAGRFFLAEERPAFLLRPAGYNYTTTSYYLSIALLPCQYELQDRHR